MSQQRFSGARAAREASESGAGTRACTAALISVCLGFFVIQLDVTVVNVALPAIQRDLGGSLAGLHLPLAVAAVGYLAAIALTSIIRRPR